MKNNFDVIIIGGGAAGMIAAITAGRRGKSVLLVEKNEKPGKKILVTGNGRCNITNENAIDDTSRPLHYHGTQPKFALGVLSQFNIYETKEFFSELGIEFIEEDSGRLFPSSNQAQSVVDVLLYEIDTIGVKLAKPNRPKSLRYNNESKVFEIVLTDGRKVEAPKLVIATGGKTHSKLGSSGDGYDYAELFGHTITPTFPAYVALNVRSPLCHKLQGVKLEVSAKAYADGKLINENKGTIMFAHFGLSAPVILEISRDIAQAMIINDKKIQVEINFLPEVPKHELEQFVLNRWQKSPNKTLGFSFVGLLPHKVFPALLEVEGIDPNIRVAEVSKELRRKIVALLSSYKFEVESVRDFEEAHFTAGGVSTKEIEPITLESKVQKGLYFCGEVIDIDGDCGGFNLQWAWSSGAVVGINI